MMIIGNSKKSWMMKKVITKNSQIYPNFMYYDNPQSSGYLKKKLFCPTRDFAPQLRKGRASRIRWRSRLFGHDVILSQLAGLDGRNWLGRSRNP
jgi:hypothetical protein